MSDGHNNALFLHDLKGKKTRQIANSPSGGYAYNWSPDGAKLGFKLLAPDGEGEMPLQQPVVFDVAEQGDRSPLPDGGATGGRPLVLGRRPDCLHRRSRASNRRRRRATRSRRSRWTTTPTWRPISPDGTKVAYNDSDERIRVLDLATGQEVAADG